MAHLLLSVLFMHFPKRLANLRKTHSLTQQAMADKIGIHVSQLKRYEAGTSQPTLEIFRKIALALHVSADQLLFDPQEREVQDTTLKLQFEAIAHLPEEEQYVLKEVIDGMILKYEARRWTGAARSPH